MITPKSNDDQVSACYDDCVALSELVRLKGQPTCIEIGSYKGYTTHSMIEGNASRVFSIDLWNGDLSNTSEDWNWQLDKQKGLNVLKQFCKKSGETLFNKVFPVIGSGDFWSKVWPFSVDLIFIDGDHSYESCKKDIDNWLPHLKDDGILCGHDYNEACPGVMQAVQESFNHRIVGRSVWVRNVL